MAIADEKVVEIVHDLFKEHPEAWTKHASAKDKNGGTVDHKSPAACSLCTTGAISRYSDSVAQANRIIKLVEKFAPNHYQSVQSFNDAAKTVVDDVVHVLGSVKLHLKHSS